MTGDLMYNCRDLCIFLMRAIEDEISFVSYQYFLMELRSVASQQDNGSCESFGVSLTHAVSNDLKSALKSPDS